MDSSQKGEWIKGDLIKIIAGQASESADIYLKCEKKVLKFFLSMWCYSNMATPQIFHLQGSILVAVFRQRNGNWQDYRHDRDD